MLSRHAEIRLTELLRRFPAVSLVGPRQAGKTTLAIGVAESLGDRAVYLDLELPSHRARLSDPEAWLASHEGHLVVLDEIHRAPEIFQILRGVIDKRRRRGLRTGQFLVLGSASIELLRQSSESLAGRIAQLELTPFTATEIDPFGPAGLDRLWVRGGFPDSFLAGDDAESFDWRVSFIQTYLERDVPMFGPRIPAETLRRFWEMLAHNQGQMLNAARLAGSLAVSAQTIARYLDLLVDLFLVRRLQPWAANAGKRLVRSPKTYVRDSGVVHALLGIEDRERLLGHPVSGSTWEGLVIENLLAVAPQGTRPSFYRTTQGAEIDLVLDIPSLGLWAIEVKRSVGSPKPAKGFHIACADIGVTRRFVVYPGTETYPLDANTSAIPLPALMRLLAPPAAP